MSRCCICLASGEGHADLLITPRSSAAPSLTYCDFGQPLSASVTAATTCALLTDRTRQLAVRCLASATANNKRIVDQGRMSVFLITSYQHLLNCGTSHDRGDKLPISMNEQTIWVIRSPYVPILFWLILVSHSHTRFIASVALASVPPVNSSAGTLSAMVLIINPLFFHVTLLAGNFLLSTLRERRSPVAKIQA